MSVTSNQVVKRNTVKQLECKTLLFPLENNTVSIAGFWIWSAWVMLLAIHCLKVFLLRTPQKPAVIKPIAISVVELRDLNHLLSTVTSSGCPTAVFIVVKIPLNHSVLLEISNITLNDVSISHPWMTRM